MTRSWRRRGVVLSALLLIACGPSTTAVAPKPGDGPIIASLPEVGPGRIDLRQLADRPRLALVTRDGDPSPAVAVVFLTDGGSPITAALAAVVESRARNAGFDVDVRVDRDAFTVRVSVLDPSRAPALFTALDAAVTRPLVAGGADLALAAQRLEALRRNPLDATELSAVTACTGALGVAASEATVDLTTPPGLAAIETARRSLDLGRIAVGATGPAAFIASIAHALELADGWPHATAALAGLAWPGADTAGVYLASNREGRLTVAARVADPLAATAAAERLGSPDSALVGRLRALPEPWRVTEATGVARVRGGCVALVLEPARRGPFSESTAAYVAAIARHEISAELGLGATPAVAAREILAAGDARDSASRSAWWSLAAYEQGAPTRWVTALGLPIANDRSVRDETSEAVDRAADARFLADVERASGVVGSAERRTAVERGQGELWLLLASPCGVAEEGTLDAGLGALATLAAVETRRRVDDVSIEPWITSDGIGVVAHARIRDERESPLDLAVRVADAAARVVTATSPSADAYDAARFAILAHLERSAGGEGAALSALASAAAPDHPSWLEPFGVWSRIGGATAEGARLRARALAQGPLRVAVIANVDAAQATTAADAVDRWLSPSVGPRACHGSPATPPHPGRYEARLPEGAPVSQVLVGVPLPGAQWRDLAELTAAALDGSGGLLRAGIGDAWSSARVVGGARAPMLIVDLRTGSESLATATAEAKAVLLRLASSATDQDFARALAEWERREARAHESPRGRLMDLWLGRRAPAAKPTLASWRAFLAATIRDGAFLIAEARPR